jgi:hypothetical protein
MSGKVHVTILSNRLSEKVFNGRLKYKREKSPLEAIHKILLNSLYGKTIQKPIDDEESEFKYKSFLSNHHDNINEIIESEAPCSRRWPGGGIKRILLNKGVEKSSNFTILGLHILSMSKRIMNEIFDITERLSTSIL